MWDKFTEVCDKVTNHPVFIAITTVLSILLSALIVLSKTSWGKKAINDVKAKFNASQKFNEETRLAVRENLKTIEDFKDEQLEVYDGFRLHINEEVKIIYSKYEIFENDLLEILSLIPNAKVQAKITNIRNQIEKRDEEIRKVVGGSYNEIQSYIEQEAEKIANEKIATLSEEIESLKQLFKNNIKVPEIADLSEETEEDVDEQTNEDSNREEEVAKDII